MTRKIVVSILLTCLIGFLSGCAATKQADDVLVFKRSGFLDNYSMLRKGMDGEALRVYKNYSANWPFYKKIQLDPVQIWYRHESKKDVSHLDLQRLANNFYNSLYAELSKDFEMTPFPEHQTLRIQIALTDVEKSSAALDIITTIVPVGLVISKGMEFATGKPSFVGETSVEFKVIDAVSGNLLAAGMDRKIGQKTIKEIDSWADANNAFKDWAKIIRARLCKLQGRRNCAKP